MLRTVYIQKEVAATMSERITRRLQERYIKNNMYYRLHYLDGRIKDADQRLAEDVRQFGDAFTDLAIWMVTATGLSLSVLCVPSR